MLRAKVILGIIVATLLLSSCNCDGQKKEPVKIVVDFPSKWWSKMDGDSIWWSHGKHITDSPATDSTFEIVHEEYQDTVYGLKNFKPLVIIKDKDTMRYWFGDTVRFNVCNPDTVIIYRDIKHANNVYIGGN